MNFTQVLIVYLLVLGAAVIGLFAFLGPEGLIGGVAQIAVIFVALAVAGALAFLAGRRGRGPEPGEASPPSESAVADGQAENFEPDEMTFIGYPENYMLAIMHSRDETEAAIQQFKDAGFPEEQLMLLTGEAGAHEIDSHGTGHGPITGVGRTFDRLLADHADLEEYHEASLRRGAYVLGIRLEDDARKDDALEVFRQHGATDVNFFGSMTVETLDHRMNRAPSNGPGA